MPETQLELVRREVVARIDAVKEDLETHREDVRHTIEAVEERVRADLVDLGAHLTDRIDRAFAAARAEDRTYREGRDRQEETRWLAHTGENGDHDKLALQRQEDMTRVRTYLTAGAVIIGASLGGVVTFVLTRVH